MPHYEADQYNCQLNRLLLYSEHRIFRDQALKKFLSPHLWNAAPAHNWKQTQKSHLPSLRPQLLILRTNRLAQQLTSTFFETLNVLIVDGHHTDHCVYSLRDSVLHRIFHSTKAVEKKQTLTNCYLPPSVNAADELILRGTSIARINRRT